MSAADVPNALVRLLEERPENWRTLADLAVDFAPPHVARAAGVAMSDPSADPTAVLDAIRSVPDLVFDDSPLHIGSIEPETLDFAPVSTITGDAYVGQADIDLDFGSGTDITDDVFDHVHPIYEHDELHEDLPSTELDDAPTSDHIESLEDELAPAFEDDFEDDFEGDLDDEVGDDGDDIDVGD